MTSTETRRRWEAIYSLLRLVRHCVQITEAGPPRIGQALDNLAVLAPELADARLAGMLEDLGDTLNDNRLRPKRARWAAARQARRQRLERARKATPAPPPAKPRPKKKRGPSDGARENRRIEVTREILRLLIGVPVANRAQVLASALSLLGTAEGSQRP